MSESKLPLAGIIILLSTIPHQEFTNIALKINSTNISKICRVKISNKLQNTREIYLRLPQAMKEIHPTSYQQMTDSFSQVDCTCSILTNSSLIKLKNNIFYLELEKSSRQESEMVSCWCLSCPSWDSPQPRPQQRSLWHFLCPFLDSQ